MIIEVEGGYQMMCDGCGKTYSHGERKTFSHHYAVVEDAKSMGWQALKSHPFRDFCPTCLDDGNKSRR